MPKKPANKGKVHIHSVPLDLEESFRTLAYHLPLGLTLHEIILDKQGRPVDYTFLDVNPEFERMTGLTRNDLIGKRVLEVLPNTEYYWIERYGKVALTGEATTFESYSCEMGKHYRVRAYSCQANRFAVIIEDITEERQIRFKLEENRQVMSRLVMNLPGIAYRCRYEFDWPMVFISQGCLKITGYTDKEFYDNKVSWGNLIEDYDRALVQNEIVKSVEKHKPFQFEYRIRNRNGRTKWVWEKGIGIYDQNGNVSGIEGFISDVTERRLTEDALAESTRSYRDLIDGMNETIWIIDLDGNIVDVNKTAINMLGYSKEELISIGLKGIDSLLDVENISNLIMNMPSDRFQMFETSHRAKSGRIYPVEIYSSLITYHGRKSILSIARDISRRKRDEKIQQILFEIAKTSSYVGDIADLIDNFYVRLMEVLEAKDLCVALYDSSDNVLKEAGHNRNQRECRVWPIDNSLPGMVFKSGHPLIVTPENRQQLIEDKGITIDKDLQLYWAGVPLRENGNFIGVFIAQSMNENPYDKNTTRLLETIAHELTVVIERKRHIHDLIAAKNKAEESDKLKTAFLANISHEIRTPMNGILGFLDLLRIPDLDDARKEKFIELVNVSGQRLLETINKIIETAKLEAGQVEMNYSIVDLNETLLYHFDFFQQQALVKKLKFEMSAGFKGDEAKIWTDKFKLNAILTNLLNNAFKFTLKGCIELGYYGDDSKVVFFVKDTGIGIPDEKIESVFERFVQADINITRPYEGSGLGLSIVRAYVELLKGSIWVKSEAGVGSVFYVSLPLVRAYEDMTFNDKRYSMKANGSGRKILIAEDDHVSIEYLRTVLTNSNFDIIHAYNGSETVKAAFENPDISVILMDIKMPEMNGLDAARKIREFNKSVPIIAQSAHAFGDDKLKAIDAGCNDYISKPVNILNLMAMLNKYVNIQAI